MKKTLIIFFSIFELGAIILYVLKEINTRLFILFTIISIGSILVQKINYNKEKK